MENCFLVWLDYFEGCYLQLKPHVVLFAHWIVEVDFSFIDFARDGTLLGVHNYMQEVTIEVVLGHVHSALGNKFDVNFAVLASHD